MADFYSASYLHEVKLHRFLMLLAYRSENRLDVGWKRAVHEGSVSKIYEAWEEKKRNKLDW